MINSAELGMPTTLIAEAVFARCISALKDDRIKASTKLRGPKPAITRDKAKFIEDIRCALYASKIVSYAQGFMLMRAAAKEYGWKLNYGNIALMWRGGCIIRSAFLGKIKDAYDKHPRLQNLLLDTFFKRAIRHSQKGWRNVVAVAAKRGIPVPAISTALAFFDSYRTEQLPANLLQAQRIISARTPMSGSINRAVNSSIPTGPDGVATYLPLPTTPNHERSRTGVTRLCANQGILRRH